MAEQTSAIENKTARIRELVDTLSAAGGPITGEP